MLKMYGLDEATCACTLIITNYEIKIFQLRGLWVTVKGNAKEKLEQLKRNRRALKVHS